VLRGLYQAVRGHGDRFRQCTMNAGIEVGSLLRGPTHSGKFTVADSTNFHAKPQEPILDALLRKTRLTEAPARITALELR
jgi:hypothetical protein